MKTKVHYYHPSGERQPLPETDIFDRWLDPEHTAVICIDMHRGHVGPEPPEELSCPAPRARDRIPAHNAFLAECRNLDVPVIQVQHWQRYGGIDDLNSKNPNGPANWRVLYPLVIYPFFKDVDNPPIDEHSWEGTKWLDLMIDEDPRDYKVHKKRMSSFFPNDMEFLLRQLDARNIVVTGTMTEACVLATSFDAADRDFRVVVCQDVHGGSSAEIEQSSLSIISTHLGLVMDSPELLREWYARKGRPVPDALAEAKSIDEAIQRGLYAGAEPVSS